MKKYLLVFVLLVSTFLSFAQDGPKRTPEERAAQFVKMLNKELTLTTDQSSKIQALQLETIKKTDEIRAKGMEGDKKAMRQEMKTVNDGTDMSIKALLTEDQKTKFAAWQEKRKEEMKNRQGGGGGPNKI